MIIPPQFVRLFLTLIFFAEGLAFSKENIGWLSIINMPTNFLLNETKQNHYHFLHFFNCYNPLKWLCCTQEVVICRGSYPSDMYNPRLTNGEEKSLRHVAMVVKVLDDKKPIKSLKSLFALFQTLPILFSFI